MKDWTGKEIEILRDNYSRLGGIDGMLASGLLPGRSWHAIRNKIKRVDIKVVYEVPELNISHDDAVYIAGIIDGEGYVGMSKITRSRTGSNWFTPRVSIVNTNMVLMNWLMQRLGGQGLNVYIHARKKAGKIGWKKSSSFQISGPRSVAAILNKVLPYLVLKQEQAILVLDLAQSRIGLKKGTPYQKDYLPIWERLRELNRRGDAEQSIDKKVNERQ